jgi:hypothetical protein
VYGGPKWTVSPVYEGMLEEEMDAAAERHRDVAYRPTLIDATYAGLLTEAHERALVIPALNRDGDCLSDLVLAMFGSIAGAESVLISLDDNLRPKTAMAEAPHRHGAHLDGQERRQPDGHVAGQRRPARSGRASDQRRSLPRRPPADCAARRSTAPPRACAPSTWAARPPRATWSTTSSPRLRAH